MNSFQAKMQIGKNGITSGLIESMTNALKNHRQVRISVLKSCCRDREELKKLADELKAQVKQKCACRIIGYTIIIVKLSKR